MKSLLVLLLLCTSAFLQSCSSGSNSKKNTMQKTADSVPPREAFQKGQIVERVVCKNDTSQNYSLYLPSTYSPKKKYPIIYAFDPHQTGKLPVSLYKDLAEQYGYIIAGSNNSKNGNPWEESKSIAAKLFADAGNRLSINTQRIYLLGFSGGARVANGLAITDGSIAGVICCGASAPANNSSSNSPLRNNYSFFGIAGNEDFNYTEMKKYDMTELAGHNIKHILITFDGKHEWPPKDHMDQAFWWLELNEMRKNIPAKNDSLIAKRLLPWLKQAAVYQQKKQVFEAYNLYRKIITFYDGLADLSSCFTSYKSLQTNTEIDRQLKQEEILWKEEEALKQQYSKALQTKDIAWWTKDIASLNQKIKTGKDKNKVLMYKRTLGFLSIAGYMQASSALKQNILPAAAFFSKFYVLADPTNTEAHYLTASVYAKEGNNKEALNSLSSAVKLGFKDLARLQNDEAFASIKSTKEFEEIIKTVKK